jgi:hypothetical protein
MSSRPGTVKLTSPPIVSGFQRLRGRPEGHPVPRQLGRGEASDLGRLLGRLRLAQRAPGEDDEHDTFLRARVDADQRVDLDVDLHLLARLAPRRVLDRLAEVDEPARERPQPLARVERAS